MRIALFPLWFAVGSFAGFGLLSSIGYVVQ